MDVDNPKTGIDTSDNPEEDTERMAPESSFQNMTPDTETSSAMDNSKHSLHSNANIARTGPARHH